MKHRSSRPADPRTRERLLDLAEEASLYLRRHGEPSVRVAAALLLASSLAACSPGETPAEPEAPTVTPLENEIREGLPASPGRYPVDPASVGRNEQGVYVLAWRTPDGTSWNEARVSLLRLAEGGEDVLEIPSSGDPVLWLTADTPVALIEGDGSAQTAAEASPEAEASPSPTAAVASSGTTSTSSRSSAGYSSRYHGSVAWYPFPVVVGTGGSTASSGSSGAASSSSSSGSVASTTPAYRNPPAAAEPGQGSVRGSSSSLVAPSTSARTWSSTGRASGQAGGPGRGTAASSRSGAGESSARPSQGAARPSSSGFTGGRSGSASGSSVG